jgi:V/A-type H+-transporting ATPase subunit I
MRRMEIDQEMEERRKELEAIKVRVDSLIETLDPERKLAFSEEEKKLFYQEHGQAGCDELKQSIENVLRDVEKSTKELAEKKNSLENEFATLTKYKNIVRKIHPLASQLVTLEDFETVALLVEKKFKGVLEIIREEVAKITKGQFELVSADVDEDTTAALMVFSKAYSEPVNAFLWAEKVNQVRLPEEFSDMPFEDAFNKMTSRLEELPSELNKVKAELRKLSSKWLGKLVAIKDILEDRCGELQVAYFAGQTDYTFVIQGWIPTKYLKQLRKSLLKEFGERVVISELPLSHEELEEAPVVLENPRWARPFQDVINLFGSPRYGTIDPTVLVAFFYPVFFGFIIGDMGYGLTLFLLCLLARRKWGKIYFVRITTSLLMLAGISATIFGFFFGEVFGELPTDLKLVQEVNVLGITLPFNRMHGMMPYMLLAVALGCAHLILGYIIGIVNAWREKAKGHMIEKIGFLLLFFFLFFFVAYVAKLFHYADALMALSAVLGLVFILWGAGAMGLAHLPSFFSNIFSYIRLMALGVAGVVLAIVANELGRVAGSVWAGLLIAVLLHTINLIVHSFSSTIHSLRLNLLEFFNKFYEPGGRAYQPFKRAGR